MICKYTIIFIDRILKLVILVSSYPQSKNDIITISQIERFSSIESI
jgi:hypothetical protein